VNRRQHLKNMTIHHRDAASYSARAGDDKTDHTRLANGSPEGGLSRNLTM
jgi:hypothetical protein